MRDVWAGLDVARTLLPGFPEGPDDPIDPRGPCEEIHASATMDTGTINYIQSQGSLRQIQTEKEK